MLKINLKLSKLIIAGALPLLFLLTALYLSSIINNKQEEISSETNKADQEQPLSYIFLSYPQVSINNQVAYIKGDNLFVSDIDGNNTKQLTSYPVIKDAPIYKSKIIYFEWSPNGKKIAYTTTLEDSETKKREFQITIIDTETNTSVNSIAFSALFVSDVVPMHWFNSSNLLFVESSYEPEREGYSPMINSKFYLIDIYSNHKEFIREIRGSGVPDFILSPDRRYLAFTGGAGNWINLYVIDLVKGMSQHTDYNAGSLGKLSWSPSNQFLAYEGYGLSGYSSVSIYDVNQKVDIQPNPEGGYLGETKSFDIWYEIEQFRGKGRFNINYNRWIENDRLLFSTYTHGDERKEKKDIEKEINFWTVSANGENLKHIWNYKWVSTQSNAIGGVVFSDDFKKIVFKEYIAPDYTSKFIYSINIDGSNKREIANNKVEE